MGDAPAKARPNKAVEPTAPRAACGSSTSFMARRLTAGVRRPKARGKEATYRHKVYKMTGECERRGKRQSASL